MEEKAEGEESKEQLPLPTRPLTFVECQEWFTLYEKYAAELKRAGMMGEA